MSIWPQLRANGACSYWMKMVRLFHACTHWRTVLNFQDARTDDTFLFFLHDRILPFSFFPLHLSSTFCPNVHAHKMRAYLSTFYFMMSSAVGMYELSSVEVHCGWILPRIRIILAG